MLFVLQITKAQVFSSEPNIINDNLGIVNNINQGDFDNDDNQDILIVTSQLVAWFKSIDSNGNFSEPITISIDHGQSFDNLVVDLNQDGYLDILVSSFENDQLYFYRNLGGGSFAPRQVLAENLNRVRSAEAADLNGNGFLDLVVGITNSVGFYWMKHLDGQGTFGPPTLISTALAQARTQKVGDINGNGFLDVLSNSGGSTLLSWYENDGAGNFTTQHIVETFGFYHTQLFLEDIDNDSDLDIVTKSSNGIFWYENLDGLGNFGPKQTINPTSDPNINYQSLAIFDIDNNGSIDVVYYSTVNNGINYQLNDGSGNFSSPFFVDPPSGLHSGLNMPVDIDNDGDLDLVNIATIGANTDPRFLIWHENQTILNIQDSAFKGLTITPNPVDNLLTIKSKTPIKTVTFYQVEGKTLKTIESGFEAIDVSFLKAGVYFVLIEGQEGERVVNTVIKK